MDAETLSAMGSALNGIGGVGGMVGGLIGAWNSNKARKNARKAINNWNDSASKMLDDYETSQVNLSNPGDVETYQKMKSSFDPNDFIYDFKEFDKSKYNVDDFVNANKDRILADVGQGVQTTAAGAGLGHSSGALNAIVNAQMNKSEELYDNAYNRMNNERNFDYNEYQSYIQNMQNKLNQQYQMQQNQMNQLKGDIQFDQQQNADNVANRINLGNTITQAKASLV